MPYLLSPCVDPDEVYLCWIFKQSMGATNLVGIYRVVIPDRQATHPCGIGSLESILGLLKSLKFGL
jgi:hypothetical protein